MNTYIALFRGINVGGRNTLPMKALVAILENLGCAEVSTYIQSGNAVFRVDSSRAGQLEDEVGAAVLDSHGFQPGVLLLPATELETIISNCPFRPDNGKALHYFFLASPPENARLSALEDVKKPSEAFALIDRTFYLHAPDGIGRSKLATGVEKALGVPTTARNWNTVRKLAAMAAKVE